MLKSKIENKSWKSVHGACYLDLSFTESDIPAMETGVPAIKMEVDEHKEKTCLLQIFAPKVKKTNTYCNVDLPFTESDIPTTKMAPIMEFPSICMKIEVKTPISMLTERCLAPTSGVVRAGCPRPEHRMFFE